MTASNLTNVLLTVLSLILGVGVKGLYNAIENLRKGNEDQKLDRVVWTRAIEDLNLIKPQVQDMMEFMAEYRGEQRAIERLRNVK